MRYLIPFIIWIGAMWSWITAMVHYADNDMWLQFVVFGFVFAPAAVVHGAWMLIT